MVVSERAALAAQIKELREERQAVRDEQDRVRAEMFSHKDARARAEMRHRLDELYDEDVALTMELHEVLTEATGVASTRRFRYDAPSEEKNVESASTPPHQSKGYKKRGRQSAPLARSVK